MNRGTLLLICLLWPAAPPAAMGQGDPTASVEVEVDRSEITIGDRIEYRIHIAYDPGVEIQKPGWGRGLESFQILDFQRGNPKKVGSRWETTDVYTLSTFTPEDYLIPPVHLPVKFPSGATQVLETQPIAVKVASVLPDDETVFEIKDIREPVAVYSGIDRFRIAMAAALVIGLVLVAFLYRYLRKKDEFEAIPLPPRPEHEIAFEKLRSLRERVERWPPEPDAAACKEFGLELSEAFREYLEKRLGILALEMTTEQLEEHFRRAPLDGTGGEASVDDSLLNVLRSTDLLKFARGTDSKEALLARLSETERLIDATKRIREVLVPPPEQRKEAA